MTYTTLVSAETLANHLDKSDWVVFDCRFSLADCKTGEKSYRLEHIPGARYAHLNTDLSSPVKSYTGRHPLPDFTLLTRKLGAWGVNNRSQIVVYDDAGGPFAGRMWWLLRCMGHDRVAAHEPRWSRRLGDVSATGHGMQMYSAEKESICSGNHHRRLAPSGMVRRKRFPSIQVLVSP